MRERGVKLVDFTAFAELGFRLNKQQFNDAICMRYDIRPRDAPSRCACGEQYSINHCLSCKNGGYVHIRHSIIRNTIHNLVKDICKDVKLEPSFLPLTGESLPAGSNISAGARSDISAIGFWNPMSRAFFDKGVKPHGSDKLAKRSAGCIQVLSLIHI